MTKLPPYESTPSTPRAVASQVYGAALLWIGRSLLIALAGFASLLTLGSIASNARQTGNIDMLLDLQHPIAIVTAKLFECALYWSAVIAYLLNYRSLLILTCVTTAVLLAWDVIANVVTPGFQLRFLTNHLDIALPLLLIVALLAVLPLPLPSRRIAGRR